MKEELQGKLVEILTSIQTATGKASDFAMTQLPDIAQSYVLYGRAVYGLGLIFCMLLLIGSSVLVWHGLRSVERSRQRYRLTHNGDEPGYFNYYKGDGHWMGAFMSAVIGGMGLIFVIPPAFLVWFAPKVWLLKEIAHLVR